MQTQVLGLSVDSVPSLQAWANSLGGISYALLSDFFPHGEVAQRYGVLRPEGYSERALFVIDRKGIIRYVDVHDIDSQPDNEVLFSVLAELEPRAAARYAELERQLAEPEPAADVVMYTTPWCTDSKEAREYLRGRGIEFAEVDISRNREAAQRVKGWANGYETTPTFVIRGKVIVDYDRAKLDEALEGLKR